MFPSSCLLIRRRSRVANARCHTECQFILLSKRAWTLLEAALREALVAGNRLREEAVGKKEVGGKWVFFFLPQSIPAATAAGLFHRGLPHFISRRARLFFARACVSYVRVPLRRCDLLLRLYLFSISLMLGSGFTPALPWPTGRRGLGGEPGGGTAVESAPQTRTCTHIHSLPFLLLFLLFPPRFNNNWLNVGSLSNKN